MLCYDYVCSCCLTIQNRVILSILLFAFLFLRLQRDQILNGSESQNIKLLQVCRYELILSYLSSFIPFRIIHKILMYIKYYKKLPNSNVSISYNFINSFLNEILILFFFCGFCTYVAFTYINAKCPCNSY